MITMAITVAIAIVGTTLSCMNTAMRISCGMAEDRELPRTLGYIHDRHTTPHIALGVLILVTSAIAAIGVRYVVGLTGITLASNFGTFVLYGLTCAWTVVAFKGRKEFSLLKHGIVPVLGMLTNVVMLAAILTCAHRQRRLQERSDDLLHHRRRMADGQPGLCRRNHRAENVRDEDGLVHDPAGATPARGRGAQGRGSHHGHDGDEGERVRPAKRAGGRDSRKRERITFVSKLRVDVVVKEWDVRQVMDIIGEGARTGQRRRRKDFRH